MVQRGNAGDRNSAIDQAIWELSLKLLEMIPLTHFSLYTMGSIAKHMQAGARGSRGSPSLILRGEMMRLYKPLVRLAGSWVSYLRNSLLHSTLYFTILTSYWSLRLIL